MCPKSVAAFFMGGWSGVPSLPSASSYLYVRINTFIHITAVTPSADNISLHSMLIQYKTWLHRLNVPQNQNKKRLSGSFSYAARDSLLPPQFPITFSNVSRWMWMLNHRNKSLQAPRFRLTNTTVARTKYGTYERNQYSYVSELRSLIP